MGSTLKLFSNAIKLDKKKKITFVINYFYPDVASTGQLMTDLCRELQHDFEITVIAGQPGYAGEKAENKKIVEVDYLETMKVIRLKLPNVNKTSKISRIKYMLSYFFLALWTLLKEKNTTIIYSISQPPILGGLIGTIGKFLKGSKHIYNIQDFNPEQAAAVHYTGSVLVYNIALALDKLTCNYANKVIVVGNDMIETLKGRFKGKKIPNHAVINNWTSEDDIIPLPKNTPEILKFKEHYGLKDKFIIMYSGNIGLFYDLENIIHVSKEFRENDDIVFVYIGEGVVKGLMQQYVKDHHLQNVRFLPYQPKDFIKYSLNVADIHFVVNQRGIKGVSVPSKIYGVMAAGKPILGVLEKGSEAERLIANSESGIVVEPKDYEGIIHAINCFYNMDKESLHTMGYNGRTYLEDNLKKEKSINKYREVINAL